MGSILIFLGITAAVWAEAPAAGARTGASAAAAAGPAVGASVPSQAPRYRRGMGKDAEVSRVGASPNALVSASPARPVLGGPVEIGVDWAVHYWDLRSRAKWDASVACPRVPGQEHLIYALEARSDGWVGTESYVAFGLGVGPVSRIGEASRAMSRTLCGSVIDILDPDHNGLADDGTDLSESPVLGRFSWSSRSAQILGALPRDSSDALVLVAEPELAWGRPGLGWSFYDSAANRWQAFTRAGDGLGYLKDGNRGSGGFPVLDVGPAPLANTGASTTAVFGQHAVWSWWERPTNSRIGHPKSAPPYVFQTAWNGRLIARFNRPQPRYVLAGIPSVNGDINFCPTPRRLHAVGLRSVVADPAGRLWWAMTDDAGDYRCTGYPPRRYTEAFGVRHGSWLRGDAVGELAVSSDQGVTWKLVHGPRAAVIDDLKYVDGGAPLIATAGGRCNEGEALIWRMRGSARSPRWQRFGCRSVGATGLQAP
jgi:hypothetical protein